MPFEETKEQEQIYTFMRNAAYLFLIIELILYIPVSYSNQIFDLLIKAIYKVGLFSSLLKCKILELTCIIVVAIGTKARKDINFNMKRMVIIPLISGVTLTALCFLIYAAIPVSEGGGVTINRIFYAIFSVGGIVLIHRGLDSLAKRFNASIGNDRFNFENEAFMQSTQKDENDYSVNIPMFFYFKKRMHKGWINISNPFRGTIVAGTPGSGKSFSVIEPFIRQHSAKGFTMMVYDYKYPTLSKNLFYQFCKNRKLNRLPAHCGFHVVNFSDVEYSDKINPIQSKYIPDLASASETAATLLAALNKGGGEKKGGSEAFFTNSAENFLASIIYFFVTFRPTGYKHGKRLHRYAKVNGQILKLVYRGWSEIAAVDNNGKVIHDFIDEKTDKSCVKDDDGRWVKLEGLRLREHGYSEDTVIEKVWWEDDNGNIVDPDTITGYYSSMPHVLSFLGHGYDEVFSILMCDDKIASLMAPFQSAFKNKANDQLEGMVGTLRVNTARLVSPEAYWVFSGDDFDLKISDPKNPCYLIIANDPEKEQVIGALNALILNRLITRINSKGNIPVSIIVDELPTLYFHKIDRLIGTARSNKVSVLLGFQELPQLEADYGKVGMQRIISTCGNIFLGSGRNNESLKWISNELFGKYKQIQKSVTIDDRHVSMQLSEKMEPLLPASKIADMATGWLAGLAARDFYKTDKSAFKSVNLEEEKDFETSKYFCKTNFDMKAIQTEERMYRELPKIYRFADSESKEIALNRNFKRINQEIDELIEDLSDK